MKALKTFLAFALILAVLGATFSVCADGYGTEAEITKLTFGSYPQSLVTDKKLIAVLDGLAKNPVSYGYLDGAGNVGSYMKYCDVVCENDRYRGVIAEKYRPDSVYDYSTAKSADKNALPLNTYCWYKFEPLEWYTLNNDKSFLISASVIDVQYYITDMSAFGEGTTEPLYTDENRPTDTYGRVEKSPLAWSETYLCNWLNDDFFNTAFSADEQQRFIKTDGSVNVDIFSEKELLSNRSFSSISSENSAYRVGLATDYALSQMNLLPVNGETAKLAWTLKKAGDFTAAGKCVSTNSLIQKSDITKLCGVRPVINCETDEYQAIVALREAEQKARDAEYSAQNADVYAGKDNTDDWIIILCCIVTAALVTVAVLIILNKLPPKKKSQKKKSSPRPQTIPKIIEEVPEASGTDTHGKTDSDTELSEVTPSGTNDQAVTSDE